MKNKCAECGAEHSKHWTNFPQKDGAEIVKCGNCAGTEPDWEGKCINCGQSPILPVTEMCGPCTFGEADTIGGNW